MWKVTYYGAELAEANQEKNEEKQLITREAARPRTFCTEQSKKQMILIDPHLVFFLLRYVKPDWRIYLYEDNVAASDKTWLDAEIHRTKRFR